MSTSQSPARAYHHGDLRRALLDAALGMVEADGADALSLRGVARHVGVSPAAVYRHFPDKQALMEAIATEGVARLGAAQEEASRQSEPGRAFEEVGRAYVRFALANPGLFRVAFTYPGIAVGDPTNDAASSLLHHHALEMARGDAQRARVIALRAWAFVHGLAMLMLDGRVAADDALIEAAVSTRSVDFAGAHS